jgi:cell division cycle 14
VYEPFFADFGPLNLACTYRFCWKLHGLLKEADEQNQCVFFWCSAEPKKKSNAAVLVGAYLVLFGGVEAEAAYQTLSRFQPFMPFRDPTCGISTYHLSVYDCIQAISKAQKLDWIDFNNFRLDEYEYFEQVKNGDLNWMVPGKLVAFSGPSARRLEIYGYRTLVPEDYVEYFQRVGVSGIIRLNRRVYERRRFTDHGLSHYDLYFPDGSCPPERIVKRFLEIVEGTSGALAVHCKAGLGRTGVLIGCYIMKHYKFTCNEALGYLRIVRPGSVIGPQQHFLRDIQVRMWKAVRMPLLSSALFKLEKIGIHLSFSILGISIQ